ncbi:hypothetical protein BS50DRAFT_571825 [Corynespora cassiicola Philippines]|uniref:DUF7580 domain-containing protein n=1 Tax=Corynespora cassiicola Philippines TaxID=1448308 RepID=A0A2T2NT39_CORCC|nr:hypothetical protein BS50DRAFT_571825 [Corynespora cassiicola Philippines]
MSGFEIAGIVLGAFPIAIEALNKYREVARIAGFWWEIRLEFEKCRSEIRYHLLNFKRNLKQVLLPMVADESQIHQLISEPGGDLWREPSVEQQLKARLQDSYDLYLEAIQQLQSTLECINDELAFDEADIQKRLLKSRARDSRAWKIDLNQLQRGFGKTNREYQLYRLKFAIGESRRKELFAELKCYNDRLEKLLTTSDVISRLESTRSKDPRNNKVMQSAIGSFWRHADHLYKVLSKAWCCGCAGQHLANIFLQHEALIGSEFLLLFLDDSTPANTQNRWQMRDTKIQLSDPPPTNRLFTQITILPSKVEDSISTRKKNITIQPTACISPPPASSTSLNSPPSASCMSPKPEICEIKDLCAVLEQRSTTKDGYGFLEDDHKRYYIYPTSDDPSALKADDPISLRDLLSSKYHPRLTRRQRYRLALTLASSFVQLWESAWLLSSSFSPTEVLFLRDADNSSVILLDRPYVSRRFVSANNTQPAKQDFQSGITFLGILLLELCWGVLIEEHPGRKNYPTCDAKTSHLFDQLVAVEWLKEVVDEAGVDYSEAATWCLLGSKSLGSGDNWRKLLYENVVQPLERCSSYLGSNTQNTWGVIN